MEPRVEPLSSRPPVWFVSFCVRWLPCVRARTLHHEGVTAVSLSRRLWAGLAAAICAPATWCLIWSAKPTTTVGSHPLVARLLMNRLADPAVVCELFHRQGRSTRGTGART